MCVNGCLSPTYSRSGKGYLFFEPTVLGKASFVGNMSMVNPGCTVRPGMMVGPKTIINSVQRYDEDCMCVTGNLPKMCEFVDGHWIAPGSNVTPWAPAWWPPTEGERSGMDEAEAAELGAHQHKPCFRLRQPRLGGRCLSHARPKGRAMTAAALVAGIMIVFGASLWLLSTTFGQPKVLAQAFTLHSHHRHRDMRHGPLNRVNPSRPSTSARKTKPTDGVELSPSGSSNVDAISTTQADTEAIAAAAAAAEASARRDSAGATARRAKEETEQRAKGSAAEHEPADLDAGLLDASLDQLLGSPLNDAKAEADQAASEEAEAQKEEATAAAAAAEAKAAAAAATAAASHAAAAAAAVADVAADRERETLGRAESMGEDNSSVDENNDGNHIAAGVDAKALRKASAVSSANSTPAASSLPAASPGQEQPAQALQSTDGADDAVGMPTRSVSLMAGSSARSPLDDATAEAAQAAMQEAHARTEEAAAAAAAMKAKAAAREMAAAALEAGPPHAHGGPTGQGTLPTSDEHGSHKIHGGSARKASGMHPMFGALVAGVVPKTAARSLMPEQHKMRHAQHASPNISQGVKAANMNSSLPASATASGAPGPAPADTAIDSGLQGAGVGDGNPTANGPPCSIYDKYNSRCYRSFADVVVACCVFSVFVLCFNSGELYRFVRYKLSNRTGPDEKGVEASVRSMLGENRFPFLDHAKLMAVLMVIYNHFAMPSMTSIRDASYFFPSAGIFWGFTASAVRPVREALKIPPWLDIVLMAFPRNQMAILAFISGFTSKSELDVRRYEGMLFLILARILYGGLISKSESHSDFVSNFAYPDFYGGHLWYLYALVIWRLAIQVFRPLYPVVSLLSAH